MRVFFVVAAAIGASGAGCTDQDELAPASPGVRMDFAGTDFYASPFPSETRKANGRVTLAGFENPTAVPFVDQVVAMLEERSGFGRTSGVFFALTAPLAEDFAVDPTTSLLDASPVFLVAVDGPDQGQRIPIESRFRRDGGPWGTDELLSLVPLQGMPLASDTLYAAVVTTEITDAQGRALAASDVVGAIAAGEPVDGLSGAAEDDYETAIAALTTVGLATDEMAGLAVFRTGAPEKEMEHALETALEDATLDYATEPVLTDSFDDFCVYEGEVDMPVYQAGEPPFANDGGGWQMADKAPVLQGTERARIVVTIPKQPMPAEGYPVVLFSRTGGGGDRPLVDRGPRAEPGGEAIEPGTGPALTFARAGFAGVSVDGPHGGMRNVSGGDEQFLMFNVANPLALRDNVRQSALELALQGHLLEQVSVSIADCAGAMAPDDRASFDPSTIALMGHSMGATISPLTLAIEPRFKALLLSGAGGSMIENVIYKESPLVVRPLAELLLGVAGTYELHRHDPMLSLFQWANEPSDPPIYGPMIRARDVPAHVLMMQGIVDTYILPPIANATSLSLGLSLGGPALDAEDPRLDDFDSIADVLGFSGGDELALPASANAQTGGEQPVTRLVTQHVEDGIEDGHEVVFQTSGPKRQMACFLESLAEGLPVVVPADGDPTDPCPE